MIQKIWIKSFRCLSELFLDFSNSRFISIISKNNTGKSSILEACFVLGHLKSFHTKDIRQTVSANCESSFIGIQLQDISQSKNYYLKIMDTGKKFVSLNNEVVKNKSVIEHLFRCVYISSDSLLFITSTPSYRRERLDLMISQLSMSYRANLSKYKRLVAQKNSALKRRCDDGVFHQIHCLMAPLIIQIVKERQFFIRQLSSILYGYFKHLSPVDGDLEINYMTTIDPNLNEKQVGQFLDQALSKDRDYRYARFGPQRDDIEFLIDSKRCRDYYSRGISRIVAYFFQLSQAVLLEQQSKLPMLLLLDEPFSEIHYSLKVNLIKCIPQSFYIVYTSTQEDEISVLKQTEVYEIKKGSLCKI